MAARGARAGGARGRAGDSASSARRGRRRRAPHSEEEGGAERWLVTYADVLTLLLVLFIVLFSISVVNKSKFLALKTSLAAAFGNGQKSVLDGGNGIRDENATTDGQQMVMPGVPAAISKGAPITPAPTATATTSIIKHRYPAAVEKEVHDFTAIERAINRVLTAKGMSGAVRFTIDHRGLIITIVTNSLVFPGNSADLLPGGQKIIAAITPPLRGIPNLIEVDGYTNQMKVSTYPYPTGWELSSARASAVVRFLARDGLSENRLSAVGWSDQHPLYPASDPRAVTLNRRVEVVVRSTLSDSDAAQLPAAAADN